MPVRGDALIVLSVVAAALYVVYSSRHLANQHPVVLAFVQQTWALGLIVITALLASFVTAPTWPATPAQYAIAGASGVCLYAIPFSLYLHALQHVHVTVAAPYLCLIPVFGILGASSVLGEPITTRQVMGSLAVVAALYVNARLDQRNHPQPELHAAAPNATGDRLGLCLGRRFTR